MNHQYPQPQPNLSSILQTLSAYAPAPPPPQQQQSQYYHYPPPPPINPPLPNPDHEEGEVADEEEEEEEDGYDPTTSSLTPYQLSQPPPHSNPSNPSPDPHTHHQQPRSHHHPTTPAATAPSSSSSSSSSKPLPSTEHITSYPLALRHITAHLLPQQHFSPRIRHLIREQHRHERDWHRERVRLQRQLGAREESSRKLDAVLASFAGAAVKPQGEGGGGGGGGGGRAELSEAQELALFDRKVWRAQKEMVAAAERELGRLGVPFFVGRGDGGVGSPEELAELRGRVLGLLNDLCGEDGGG